MLFTVWDVELIYCYVGLILKLNWIAFYLTCYMVINKCEILTCYFILLWLHVISSSSKTASNSIPLNFLKRHSEYYLWLFDVLRILTSSHKLHGFLSILLVPFDWWWRNLSNSCKLSVGCCKMRCHSGIGSVIFLYLTCFGEKKVDN